MSVATSTALGGAATESNLSAGRQYSETRSDSSEAVMVTEELSKARVLKKCFALFPNTSRSPFVTPNDLLLTLQTIDPKAQRVSDDELKAIIAAELLTDEEEFGHMTMFEATQVFNNQASSPVVDFPSFCVMFEGKAVMSNAPSILETALVYLQELRTAAATMEADETKGRSFLESEEAANGDRLRSECRRALRITALRQNVMGNVEQQRRNINQLTLTETPVVNSGGREDVSRLQQIREERRKAKELQATILNTETNIEGAYNIAVETTTRVGEQLKVLREWQTTGMQMVTTEMSAAVGSIKTKQQNWLDALDGHLDRLDEKIVEVGRQLVLGSITRHGHKGHRGALADWHASIANGTASKSALEDGADVFSDYFTADPSSDADLSWLQVDPSSCAPANFSSEADHIGAVALSDRANLNVGGASTMDEVILSEAATVVAFLQRRVHGIRATPPPAASGTATTAQPIGVAEFELLVDTCRLPVPGSLRLMFAELADNVTEKPTMMLGSRATRSSSNDVPWENASMSLQRFVDVLKIIAALQYPRIAPTTSDAFLVRKLLDEVIRPRMHGITINTAIETTTTTPTAQKAKIAETAAVEAHVDPTVWNGKEADDNKIMGQQQEGAQKEDVPLPTTTQLTTAPPKILELLFAAREELQPMKIAQLSKAFGHYAVRYHGALPVTVRGRRGLAAARVLHAMRLASEPPPHTHGAILRCSNLDGLGDLYSRQGASELFGALVAYSKEPINNKHRGMAEEEEGPPADSTEYEFQPEASIDAVASYISLVVPTVYQHIVVQQLVATITSLMAQGFVAVPSESNSRTVIPLAAAETTLELVFGVLPGDSVENRVESGGVPFIIFVAAIVALADTESFPPLPTFLNLLCDPRRAASAQ